MPNTIMLKGDLGMREEAFAAAGTIKPGHAVIRDSSNNFKKNDLATGSDVLLQVAIEDALQGRTINDAYDISTPVFTYLPRAGDLLYVRVPAGAPAIVIGDLMQLDNTGCFVKRIAGATRGVSREALDNSGGGTEAFIKMEVV